MKLNLDQIEAVARKAQEESAWHPVQRDADYVSFGPLSDIKDNHEGSEAVYAHIAQCSPDVVLALVARIRATEAALRYVIDAWGEREGDGQPKDAVFGVGPAYEKYCAEQGIEYEQAPEAVQAVVRDLGYGK